MYAIHRHLQRKKLISAMHYIGEHIKKIYVFPVAPSSQKREISKTYIFISRKTSHTAYKNTFQVRCHGGRKKNNMIVFVCFFGTEGALKTNT